MLVLTDGNENTAPMLADVGPSITANTFAVGLGLAENISVAALNALTQGHNGYLLVTGSLSPDQAARLNKYFLQALAGITNANVILDPHGQLIPGIIQRIPFNVNETDFGLDVFLLCPAPAWVEFALEAPDGSLITPSTPASVSNVQFVETGKLVYYRLGLPALPVDATGTHSGTWNALLTIKWKGRGDLRSPNLDFSQSVGTPQLSIPYDVVVHCYSNLVFKAYASQSSFEPGAVVSLRATLNEYDVPVDNRATVWADITRPDGSMFSAAMPEVEPGRYETSFATTLSGLYTMRVRAIGTTFRATPFQREQTLTAAVFPGGDRPPQTGGTNSVQFWCEVLHCLLNEKVLGAKLLATLRERGVDLKPLLLCIEKHCREIRGVASERPGVTGDFANQIDPRTVQRLAEAITAELGGAKST